MAFDVYPNPQTATLSIGAGSSATTTITERVSNEAQPTMYIRVAMIAGAAAPSFELQAGAGDSVPVPSAVGIWDQPGGQGHGNPFRTGNSARKLRRSVRQVSPNSAVDWPIP